MSIGTRIRPLGFGVHVKVPIIKVSQRLLA
jgi:hypothetical protein